MWGGIKSQKKKKKKVIEKSDINRSMTSINSNYPTAIPSRKNLFSAGLLDYCFFKAIAISFSCFLIIICLHAEIKIKMFLTFLTLIYTRFISSGGHINHKKLEHYYLNIDKRNRIAIVTGANSGLGLETTKYLLKLNFTVIMACRNKHKTMKVIHNSLSTYYKAKKVYFIQVDLSDKDSIRHFIKEFKLLQFNSIDLLINNAGVIYTHEFTLCDDYELQFAVNHLGHFYLTSLLFPYLNSNSKHISRIINVASFGHIWAPYKLKDWNVLVTSKAKKYYSKYVSYGISKYCNMIFTKDLHQKLTVSNHSDHIKCYSVHPGMCRSSLYRNFLWYEYIIYFLLTPIRLIYMKSSFEGACTILYTALTDSKHLQSGGYYVDNILNKGNSNYAKKDNDGNLWKFSEHALQIQFLS